MGLSSRVGVRKCGLAVLAAGLLVLLAGCSPSKVEVSCSNVIDPSYMEEAGFVVKAILTITWSNGTSTVEGSRDYCEDRPLP